MKLRNRVILSDKIAEFSIIRRLKYKAQDIIKPSLDSKNLCLVNEKKSRYSL